MSILLWFIGPIGRWVSVTLIMAAVVGGIYEKGRFSQRAYDKAKVERQNNADIEKGKRGRDGAVGNLDSGRLPNWWFRD